MLQVLILRLWTRCVYFSARLWSYVPAAWICSVAQGLGAVGVKMGVIGYGFTVLRAGVDLMA
jgi:hypothetical protein